MQILAIYFFVFSASEVPLLQGTLIFIAKEAKDLPDTDNVFFNISRGDLTDPFLQVSIGSAAPIKTSVKLNNLNPVWNEEFSIPVCHHADIIKVKVGSLIDLFDQGLFILFLR